MEFRDFIALANIGPCIQQHKRVGDVDSQDASEDAMVDLSAQLTTVV